MSTPALLSLRTPALPFPWRGASNSLTGHLCPCLFWRHCSYSSVLALPMPMPVTIAHSVFIMGICTPHTLCPPEICAHVVVFAPIPLSFSYLLEFKELVVLKLQGPQVPVGCRPALGVEPWVPSIPSWLQETRGNRLTLGAQWERWVSFSLLVGLAALGPSQRTRFLNINASFHHSVHLGW